MTTHTNRLIDPSENLKMPKDPQTKDSLLITDHSLDTFHTDFDYLSSHETDNDVNINLTVQCEMSLSHVHSPSPWFQGKGLKTSFLNINRVMGKLDQVKLCLDEQLPDIFGLCETFLGNQVADKMLYHNGYTLERRDRSGKLGGGLLCYIRDDLAYKRRTDLEDPNLEIIWLEVVYSSSKNILTGFFYRPPNSNAHWMDIFSKHLEIVYQGGKEIVLLGDMNIDLLNCNVNPSRNSQKLVKILDNVNLTQIIRDPTRVSSHSKTLIDHVYVSNPLVIIHNSVPMYAVSDHYPICITRKYSQNKENANGKQISYRSIKHFDEDAFMSDMFNSPWQNVNACTSPDEALACWSSIYQDVIDKHMPIIHKRVKRIRQPKWMNEEIKHAIHTRDFLKKTKSLTGYRIWRNKVVCLIKKAKREFYVEAIIANKKNPTVLWKHLKGLCPDKQRNTPNILQTENKTITDAEEIANALNTYFASVPDLYTPVRRAELDLNSVTNISNFISEKNMCNTQFTVPSITTDFVLKQLKSMSNSKATGLDGFSVNILKISAPATIASITKVCNLSLETGKFPDKWKESKVTPIFKKGKKEYCSNYRPVSVLPILSKILEKHVFKYLYEYLQTHKLLTNSQFGFRKNQSCQTALVALTEKMYQAIYEGKYFGMVQLDLSKAFDLVNHSLLIQKLKLYRCDRSAVKWFNSYLDNRSQKVAIKQSLSKSQTMNSGVPQGSILGPLLFLLYINDMPLSIETTDELLYADDTTLSATSKHILEIETSLGHDIKRVSDWCDKNDMVLSIPKSCSMVVSTRQRISLHKDDVSNLNIKIDNDTIPCVSTTKILGVHFDRDLSWNEHIKQVHTKIVRNLYLLQQIKNFLPLDARKLFVNSYVQPHFDYCCVVWGNCSQNLLYDLEKLQKRAARLILDEVLDRENTTRSHVLFSKLKWMPLQDKITFHRAVQTFKCVNGLNEQGLELMFERNSNVHSHNTRSANDNDLYIAPRHAKSFAHLGAAVWNNIPARIRRAKNLASFKCMYVNNYFSG